MVSVVVFIANYFSYAYRCVHCVLNNVGCRIHAQQHGPKVRAGIWICTVELGRVFFSTHAVHPWLFYFSKWKLFYGLCVTQTTVLYMMAQFGFN
jgi:hypothetical protein